MLPGPRTRRGSICILTLSWPLLHASALFLPASLLPSVGDASRRVPPSPFKPARAHGGGGAPAEPLDGDRRGDVLRRALSPCAAAVLAAAIFLGPSPAAASVQQVYATGGVGSSSAMMAGEDPPREFIAELGLKPPTEGRPQIMMNRPSAGAPEPKTATARKPIFGGAPDPAQANARKPILQGLVYFPERAPPESAAPVDPQLKQPMDYYTDVLVLTAVSTARTNGPVLAGAKFPVASIRFPFSFQMYKENLLTRTPGVQDIWDGIADNGDVIVRAQICPGDVPAFPCDKTETKKGAEGIAKIITNLPGMEEGATIRAPASLPLQ